MTESREDILRKITALLAKAERTDNPNEADAFFAKAQEWMTRHAVDMAALGRESGRTLKDTVVFDTWMYSSNDYNYKGRLEILNVAAYSNRCRILLHKISRRAMPWAHPGAPLTSQWVDIVGQPDDVEFTKILYTSLLAQGLKDAKRAARRLGLTHKTGSYAYTTSHLVGYAHTTYARLREYMAPVDPTGQALVVESTSAVDEAINAKYPKMRSSRAKSRVSSYEGYFQGAQDGRNADLAQPGRSRLS